MRECESCGRCLDDGALPCCGTGDLLTEPFPGPPLVDGKYLLERRLGAGGMGSVYRALHVGLGKVFAVKVIRSLFSAAPQAVARFRIEAQALGRLSHPNVVAVTDYGVDPRRGGLPYLVMEHLPGESLLAAMGAGFGSAFGGSDDVVASVSGLHRNCPHKSFDREAVIPTVVGCEK